MNIQSPTTSPLWRRTRVCIKNTITRQTHIIRYSQDSYKIVAAQELRYDLQNAYIKLQELKQ